MTYGYRSLSALVLVVALSLTLYWAFSGGSAEGTAKPPWEGAVTETHGDACVVVRLSGPPRTKGRVMGEMLKDRIRAEIARVLPEDDGLRSVVRSCGERLQGFLPAAYLEEVKGIAEGAGVAFDEALFLDMRYELAAFGLAKEEGDLLGEGAVGPGPMAGRLLPEETARDLVVVIHEDQDPPLALLARPGMTGGFLGVRGNVAAAMRPLRPEATPTRDPTLAGLVWTLVLRRLLEEPPQGRYEAPEKVTGPVSVAMALPDGASGTFNLAVWGAAWYASSGPYSMTTDERVPEREGEVVLGRRELADRTRIADAAQALLEAAPPSGQALVTLRGGEGGFELTIVAKASRRVEKLRTGR